METTTSTSNTSTSNTSTSRTNRNDVRRVRNNPNKRVRRNGARMMVLAAFAVGGAALGTGTAAAETGPAGGHSIEGEIPAWEPPSSPTVEIPEMKIPTVKDLVAEGVLRPDGYRLPDGYELPDDAQIPSSPKKMATLKRRSRSSNWNPETSSGCGPEARPRRQGPTGGLTVRTTISPPSIPRSAPAMKSLAARSTRNARRKTATSRTDPPRPHPRRRPPLLG
ncbi:MAG: hypothetical protein R2789_01950 [Microthrixaceae bacterium]